MCYYLRSIGPEETLNIFVQKVSFELTFNCLFTQLLSHRVSGVATSHFIDTTLIGTFQ